MREQPLIVICLRHSWGVRWCQDNGYGPRDACIIEAGRGMSVLMGRSGGSFIVLNEGELRRDFHTRLWLDEFLEWIVPPCAMTRLPDWDGALDGAYREAHAYLHFNAHAYFSTNNCSESL